MKRTAIIILGFVVIVVSVLTYRAYRHRADRELAARRATISQRDVTAQQRSAAEKEAQRLAALQAQQEVEAAAQAIADLRAREAAEAERRAAAEAELLRLHAELERLRRETESMIEQTKNLTASRPNEFAAVDAAREEALARLQALEAEKNEIADRQAARAAALEEQLAKEKAAQDRVSRYRAMSRR